MNDEKNLKNARESYEVKAVYTASENPMYSCNPYIEALHPALPQEKVASLMRRKPVFHEHMRSWSALQRAQQVQEIFHYVEPLPELIDLEQKFSRMIRNGYLTRNPLPSEWRKQMESAFSDLDFDRGGADYIPKIRSNAAGFNLVGPSGAGKSTGVDSVLSTFDQVIVHTEYNGIPFDCRQLVWLKLECPANGSTKSLCLNFFRAVDKILGTNYSKKFGKRSHTQEDLLQAMASVAEAQGLGVLVIDEIQRLNEAKSGGAKLMLNFFVELSNTIGVPVVLVGTCRALKLFSIDFAQARRCSGQGDMLWTNLAQNETWEYFLESLWEYQWTNTPTPLTPALKKIFYYESHLSHACLSILHITTKLPMMRILKKSSPLRMTYRHPRLERLLPC